MEVDYNVPFFIEFIYVIGLQRMSCVLRLQGFVSEIDCPHASGVIVGAIEEYCGIIQVIDEDFGFGKFDVVIIVTELSKQQQRLVLHLREDVDASHCAREMGSIEECGVRGGCDGTIGLFDLHATFTWFYVNTRC